MNKYIRALGVVPFSFAKISLAKLFHAKALKCSFVNVLSLRTEITIERGSNCCIGKGLKMRDGSKIRVRKGAKCVVGKNVSIGSNSLIACHSNIVIGDNVQFAQNVQIFDHDHDFRAEGGLKENKFKCSPVSIGHNVWIGANCVILRGAVIGDNCVVGAGSIVKGVVPSNTILVQKRHSEFIPI